MKAKIDIIQAKPMKNGVKFDSSKTVEAKPQDPSYELTCKECGQTKTLYQRSGKRKRRTYCSEECMDIGVRKRQRELIRSPEYKAKQKAAYAKRARKKRQKETAPRYFPNEWDHQIHEAWEDPANGITRENGFTKDTAPREL